MAPGTRLTTAEAAMVEDNLGLIGFGLSALGISGTHPKRDEMWQDGVIGLARAVQLYDPSRAALSTYALPHIKVAIARGTGTREGVNHRRVQDGSRRATPHDDLAPLSLDQPVGDAEGDRRLGDLVASVTTTVPDEIDLDDPVAAARLAWRDYAVEADDDPDGFDRLLAADADQGDWPTPELVARVRAVVAHPATNVVDRPWSEGRACAGVPVSRFFPRRGEALSDAALWACAHCPVREACAAEAETHRGSARAGYRAGTSAVVRRQSRQAA